MYALSVSALSAFTPYTLTLYMRIGRSRYRSSVKLGAAASIVVSGVHSADVSLPDAGQYLALTSSCVAGSSSRLALVPVSSVTVHVSRMFSLLPHS